MDVFGQSKARIYSVYPKIATKPHKKKYRVNGRRNSYAVTYCFGIHTHTGAFFPSNLLLASFFMLQTHITDIVRTHTVCFTAHTGSKTYLLAEMELWVVVCCVDSMHKTVIDICNSSSIHEEWWLFE